MNLNLDNNSAKYQIRSYAPGKIQINDEIFTQSVIIGKETLIRDWQPQNILELTASDLTLILDLKPTILLLGTGENLTFPAVEVYGELYNHGVGVEIMTTRAACRTYNALSAEERNVLAALIIK